MDHKRKEELKKNDLADIIEAKLIELKPYGSTIGIVALLLIAVIGGVVWLVVDRQNKAEQAWTDLYSANYQAQMANSPKLLEQTASKTDNATTLPGLWARQMAADYHLNEGLRELITDREKGAEKLEQAQGEFRFVSENTDKKSQQMLWSRATFGLARASEAIGDFDSATSAYEQIVAEMPDTSLADAAAEKIAVLADPATIEWYNVFKEYKPAEVTTETGDAPGSDSGLPARPDFSFPEISIPDPTTISGEDPPAPRGGTDEESPPPPPGDDSEEKSDDVEKGGEKKADDAKADEEKADEKAKAPAE